MYKVRLNVFVYMADPGVAAGREVCGLCSGLSASGPEVMWGSPPRSSTQEHDHFFFFIIYFLLMLSLFFYFQRCHIIDVHTPIHT